MEFRIYKSTVRDTEIIGFSIDFVVLGFSRTLAGTKRCQIAFVVPRWESKLVGVSIKDALDDVVSRSMTFVFGVECDYQLHEALILPLIEVVR